MKMLEQSRNYIREEGTKISLFKGAATGGVRLRPTSPYQIKKKIQRSKEL